MPGPSAVQGWLPVGLGRTLVRRGVQVCRSLPAGWGRVDEAARSSVPVLPLCRGERGVGLVRARVGEVPALRPLVSPRGGRGGLGRTGPGGWSGLHSCAEGRRAGF